MSLSDVSLLLLLFVLITITLGVVKLHEYPGKIAEARKHPQHDAIVATSIMGLLFFPLWVFALIWAYGGVIGQPLPLVPKPVPAPKQHGHSKHPHSPPGPAKADEPTN